MAIFDNKNWLFDAGNCTIRTTRSCIFTIDEFFLDTVPQPSGYNILNADK